MQMIMMMMRLAASRRCPERRARLPPAGAAVRTVKMAGRVGGMVGGMIGGMIGGMVSG